MNSFDFKLATKYELVKITPRYTDEFKKYENGNQKRFHSKHTVVIFLFRSPVTFSIFSNYF